MKKISSFAMAGALAVAALSAQAQVAVDGQLTAAELTAGNYVLLGKSNYFTGDPATGRPFGKNGLLSLYAASTPTKLYMFIAGTVENNGNSFQLYIDAPVATPGVPAGTFLPAGGAGTSFEKVNRIKMDQTVDLALALRSDGAAVAGVQNYKIEGAAFAGSTAATTLSKQLSTATAPLVGNGTALTLPTDASPFFAALVGARVAYRNTSDGLIATNPGATTPITGAAYGGVGSFGWEIEIDRAAAGLATGTPVLRAFALQNGGDGGFASGEFIPQPTAPLPATFAGANLGGPGNGTAGNDVDFALVPGTQSVSFSLGATGVLGSRAAREAATALRFGLYPNPGTSADAKVAYTVPAGKQDVSLSVFDATGRKVRSFSAAQAGSQSYALSALRAGIYVVKLSVGSQQTSGKIVIQ